MATAPEVVFHEDRRVWWPKYEWNFSGCYSTVMRRLTDADACLPHVRTRSLAIQAGGHAGIWPMRLAKNFIRVVTFEPDPHLAECLRRNVAASSVADRIEIREAALSREAGEGLMETHASAGGWRLSDSGTVRVAKATIDDLEVESCGAIYLDVEGGEVDALVGAAKTIARLRPVLHVEELPRARKDIQGYMRKIGYREVMRVHSDAIYV